MRVIRTALLLGLATSLASAQLLQWFLEAMKELDSTPGVEAEVDSEPGPTTCPCGLTNKKTRIVGGEETGTNEYPFMLSLVYSSNGEHFCGATLISETHAITAAHCTRGAGSRPLSVIAGLHHRRRVSPMTQQVRVRRIIEHENYIQNMLIVLNDIAILELASPIRFNSVVSPVCMPKERINLENKMVKIIGWGKQGANRGAAMTLQQITVRVHTFKECKAIFGFRYMSDENKPTLMCANSPGKTACMGDSGGPALYLDPEMNRYVLIGLVSYGEGQCTGRMPTVQTDVTGYTDWINSVVRRPLCHKL